MGNCHRRLRAKRSAKKQLAMDRVHLQTWSPTPSQRTLAMQQGRHVFKVLFIGDANVGKTSLLLRLTDDRFDTLTTHTLGVDFKEKTIVVGDGSACTLRFWDTSGQERFRTITSSFYRNADIIFIVFDLTSAATYENVRRWLADVERYAPEHVVLALVGTKADRYDRVIRASDMQAMLATQPNLRSAHSTSALTGEGVERMLQMACTQCLEQLQQGQW